jgi:hypothetical protein
MWGGPFLRALMSLLIFAAAILAPITLAGERDAGGAPRLAPSGASLPSLDHGPLEELAFAHDLRRRILGVLPAGRPGEFTCSDDSLDQFLSTASGDEALSQSFTYDARGGIAPTALARQKPDMQSLLELAVLDRMLRSVDDRRLVIDPLRYEGLVTMRSVGGNGFMTRLRTDEALRVTRIVDDHWGDLDATINAGGILAGFVVFIREGHVAAVEGHSYGQEWPDRIESFEILPAQAERKLDAHRRASAFCARAAGAEDDE